MLVNPEKIFVLSASIFEIPHEVYIKIIIIGYLV